jgi:TetR/AcrR family transcriptional repressor of nem operon
MPYSPEHKPRTRARILGAAARVLRTNGIAGASVDVVMSKAGLTHGGFYGHFKSKWNMIEAALDEAIDETYRNMLKGLDGTSGDAFLRKTTDRFLSPEHIANPATGCPIPVVAPELARGPKKLRTHFGKRLSALFDELAQHFGGGQKGRERVIAAFSMWVGATVLARAVDDGALRDEIVRATKKRL